MSSEKPNQPPSKWIGPREFVLCIVVAGFSLGIPLVAAQLCGMGLRKALMIMSSRVPETFNLPVVLVWIVGCVLLLRHQDRRRMRMALVGIGGLLIIWLLRVVFWIWLFGSGPVDKLQAMLWIGEIIPSVLSAVCWGFVIALLLRSGRDSSTVTTHAITEETVAAGSFRLGWLIISTGLGAGLGFFLNAVSDEVNASPYRSVVYVVGGCVVGAAIATVLNSISRPRR